MLRLHTGQKKIGIQYLIRADCGNLANALQALYNYIIVLINIKKVPCPFCGGHMIWWGRYHRMVEFLFHGSKEREKLYIRRTYCPHCKHTHAMLPDWLIPYRQESALWQITIISEFFNEFPGFELSDKLEQALRESQAANTDAVKSAPASIKQAAETATASTEHTEKAAPASTKQAEKNKAEQCDAPHQLLNNTFAGIDFVNCRTGGKPEAISHLIGRLRIEPSQLYYAIGTYIKDKRDWFGEKKAKIKDDLEFLRELKEGNAPKPVQDNRQRWKVPYLHTGESGKASDMLREFAEANGRSLFTGFRDIRTKAERNALTYLLRAITPKNLSLLFG